MKSEFIGQGNSIGFDKYGIVGYLLFCFFVFSAAHGAGIILDWFNPDDWANSGGKVWIGSEGRWVPDVIFRHVYQYSLPNSLQFFLALASYSLVPLVVLRRKFGDELTPFHYFLFCGIVLHPYQVDVLNFDIALAIYPVAFLLVTAVGSFMVKPSISWDEYILCACIVFIVASVYQLIVLWFFTPFIFYLMDGLKSETHKILIAMAMRLIVVFVVGVLGYFLTSYLYTEYVVGQVSSRLNYQVGGASDVVSSLISLPIQVLDHSLAIHPAIPKMYGGFLGLLVGVFGLISIRVTHKYLQVGNLRRLIEFWLLLCLLNIPVYAFGVFLDFVGVGYPPRIMYLNNFGLFLSLFVVLEYCKDASIFDGEKLRRNIILISCILLVVAGVLTANRMWFEQRKVYEHDVALTAAIYSSVVNFGISNDIDIFEQEVTLVGRLTKSPVSNRFFSVGKTIYNTVQLKYIFKAMYDFPIAQKQEVHGLTCNAYPRVGSITVMEGRVFVCLAASGS